MKGESFPWLEEGVGVGGGDRPTGPGIIRDWSLLYSPDVVLLCHLESAAFRHAWLEHRRALGTFNKSASCFRKLSVTVCDCVSTLESTYK